MVSPGGLYIHDQCYLTEHLRRLFDKYLDVHAFSDNLRIRDIINCCWNLIKTDISAINFVISILSCCIPVSYQCKNWVATKI